MATKKETVEEFLARGGAVQNCGSTMKQAIPLKRLRKEEEARIQEEKDAEERERADERYMERVREARLVGMSVSDALDYGNDL